MAKAASVPAPMGKVASVVAVCMAAPRSEEGKGAVAWAVDNKEAEVRVVEARAELRVGALG